MSTQRGGYELKREDNGYWYITWSERLADAKGWRSKRRSTGARDRKEAERILAGFILEKDRALSKDGDMLVCAALDDYWNEHAQRCESAERIDIAIRHFQKFFGGDVMVSEIDGDLVGEYCKQRRRSEIGRRASDGTLRRELNILIAAINHAAWKKRLDKNLIPPVELPEAPAAKDRWLTHEEADKLIAAANGRTKLFIQLALATAARKTALQRLTWFQVDLERRLIQLNPEGRRQTKKRRPTLPIADDLYPVLVAEKAKATSEYVLGDCGSIRTGFEAAVKRAGLGSEDPRKKVTPHTLRHTWATWAAQSGVPMEQIAAVLGDTLQTVIKNYIHWAPDYLRDAVNFKRKEAV